MAKAKALRKFVEPIITIAKNDPDSVNARRRVYARLCDRLTVTTLFDVLAPLYKDVPGGYTRIMAMGNRRGDGARLVVIELTKRTVSDDDLLGAPEKKEALKKKKTKEPSKAEKDGAAVSKETRYAAPEVDIEKKEERTVEEAKKEKAKTEQKKITQRGFFKRFRRKSI